MENIKIPVSFVLEIDDVGWDDGRDLRLGGKASRSGLPRNHAVEDYEMISELSRRSGKRITVALCVGDWDKDNLLRGEVGFTHDPHGWDRASEIDLEHTRACIDVLESSSLEYMLHGILHGLYDESGRRINERQYLLLRRNEAGKTEAYLPSEEEFERQLDMFYKIYNAWGMKKEIRSFVMPCGIDGASRETVEKMARILYRRGIRYWPDSFNFEGFTYPLEVIEGVACFNWGRNKNDMPWNAYDCDPDGLAPFYIEGNVKNSCLHGSHWTNYLRFNPKKNFENVDAWLRFYERQSEVFGSMLADDLASGVNQLFYYRFAKVCALDGGCNIDLSEVEKNKLDCHKNEFFISLKKGLTPTSCEGGEISLYETHDEFNIYKINHTANKITLKI